MRRPREVKEATHAAIVAQASRLFRERGLEGTSVGEIMAEAGLTHGGFYRHFETKDALVAAAIQAMFDGMAAAIGERAATVGARKAVEDYFEYYGGRRRNRARAAGVEGGVRRQLQSRLVRAR